MTTFIQGRFQTLSSENRPFGGWKDLSTTDCWKFVSVFGEITLRKRRRYPSTYAELEGTILRLGYGSPASAMTAALADYATEYLHIVIDAQKASITILRDAFCTVPLFINTDWQQIALANTFEAVCRLLSQPPRIHLGRLADYIFDPSISRQHTFLKDITILGERELLEWRNGRYTQRHLALPSLPEEFHKSNPHIFRRLLDEILQEYIGKYIGGRQVGVEFSGGIDSSMIAGYLADAGCRPSLTTLEFPGHESRTQRAKIEDFNRRFKTQPYVIPLEVNRHSPLSRMERVGLWQPFYEREEIYREAFEACAMYLDTGGIDVVFNGVGGDDSLSRTQDQFPGHPPAAFYTPPFIKQLREAQQVRQAQGSISALVTNEVISVKLSHNNIYLERGIWPVSPLADPRLVAYLQSLSLRFRDNKNVYRIYCASWGYPESLYRGPNENFGTFFTYCVNRHFRRMGKRWLVASELARKGALDMPTLNHTLESQLSLQTAYDYYKLITVESNLQMLEAVLELA